MRALAVVLSLCLPGCAVLVVNAHGQSTAEPAQTAPGETAPGQTAPSQTAPRQMPPSAPAQATSPAKPSQLQPRPQLSPADQAEALRISKLGKINGVPYDQPSTKDQVIDYVHDTYGLQGQIRSLFRAGFAEARGKPEAWSQDAYGFSERLGSSEAITVINGNVRLGMELLLHEDLRYLPCNGCSARKKIENALLSEITARHDQDGRRFFTLTPTIADFSGPLIAHSTWYPGSSNGPVPGFISARLVFATRIGEHLAKEFFMDPSRHTKHTDQPPPASTH